MPKGIFLALTNPASDDVDAEFNQWYADVHSKEVLALPGVNACRRFQLAAAQVMPGDDAAGRRYLALYEVDVDDWQSFADSMGEALNTAGKDRARGVLASPRGIRRALRTSGGPAARMSTTRLSITAIMRTGRSLRLRHAWRVRR